MRNSRLDRIAHFVRGQEEYVVGPKGPTQALRPFKGSPADWIYVLESSPTSEEEARPFICRFINVTAVWAAWVEPEAVSLDEVVHEVTHPDVPDGTRPA